MSKTAKDITKERQHTHGDWDEGAAIAVDVMDKLRDGEAWDEMTPGMQEAIHMIVHKMQRIVSGNPHVKDHWDDIGGYAELVSRRLAPPSQPRSPSPRKVLRGKKIPKKSRTKGVSLKGAKNSPRTATGTRGIVRTGKSFRGKKARERAAPGRSEHRPNTNAGFWIPPSHPDAE